MRLAGIAFAVLVLTIGIAASEQALPLSVGNRWEYAVTHLGVMSFQLDVTSKSGPTASRGRVLETVESSGTDADGKPTFSYKTETRLEGDKSDKPSSLCEEKLLISEWGIEAMATRSSGLNGMLSGKWEEYKPPVRLYKADPKPGDRWEQGTIRDGDMRIPGHARVLGHETVTVAAGTFKDCLKMAVVVPDVTGKLPVGDRKLSIRSGKAVHTTWIAKGVGVVKEESITQMIVEAPGNTKGKTMSITSTQRESKELLPGYRVK